MFGIILYIGQPATLKEAGRSEVQNKQKKVVLCPTGEKIYETARNILGGKRKF